MLYPLSSLRNSWTSLQFILEFFKTVQQTLSQPKVSLPILYQIQKMQQINQMRRRSEYPTIRSCNATQAITTKIKVQFLNNF